MDSANEHRAFTVDKDGVRTPIAGPFQAKTDGGDVIFIAGKPGVMPDGSPGKAGHIRFYSYKGEETLRIDPDGAFYVMGEKVDTAMAVYEAFVAWVNASMVFEAPSVRPGQANHYIIAGPLPPPRDGESR